MMENGVKVMAAGGTAVVSFLWGEWSMLLNVLLALVIIDYVTGLSAAWKSGELNSSAGLFGIAKKVFIFVIIAVANLIDVALMETGARDEPIVFTAAIVFYIVNEAISITENAGRMSMPLPDKLLQAIKVLKSRSDDKNDKDRSA
ncbi:toxin secretion/phage lysis holin [Alteribacillus persepolensis]|uniref:Toxin secretion/phage lysis holin n=1 Tax=Alteribacillus persepolensis TaxID=568899 RepID=A0A1G8IKU7_9BACI|nr:phage holin family protein [Alteribacillus persepolensis]SDI19534.1 toxin secretion/phage lysis holin [Alteribacillus persepolensis]